VACLIRAVVLEAKNATFCMSLETLMRRTSTESDTETETKIETGIERDTEMIIETEMITTETETETGVIITEIEANTETEMTTTEIEITIGTDPVGTEIETIIETEIETETGIEIETETGVIRSGTERRKNITTIGTAETRAKSEQMLNMKTLNLHKRNPKVMLMAVKLQRAVTTQQTLFSKLH
jgi:hypothetical protein